jgi:hypothetical protein
VHQHLLALLRMAVFGTVFAFGSESSEKMACFMSHRAVGSTVGDQGDALFGIGGALSACPPFVTFRTRKNVNADPESRASRKSFGNFCISMDSA